MKSGLILTRAMTDKTNSQLDPDKTNRAKIIEKLKDSAIIDIRRTRNFERVRLNSLKLESPEKLRNWSSIRRSARNLGVLRKQK